MAGELPTEGCEGNAIVAPGVPCATHNLCVLGVDQRIYRMTIEMTQSVSGRVSGMSQDDKDRIDSYYAELLDYANNAGGNMMDFHYLADMTLTDLISIQMPTDNDGINTAVQYLLGADINLRVSASSRLNDGILPTDLNDFVMAVEKSRDLLDHIFNTFNPMDYPQSNPHQPVATPTGN